MLLARLPRERGLMRQEIERLALFIGPGSGKTLDMDALEHHLGVEPDAKDTTRLVDRIYMQRGSKTVDPQALVHSVWGVSTFENYSFNETTKKEILQNLSALVDTGLIGDVHANALRDSAEDAGISIGSLDKVLPAR